MRERIDRYLLRGCYADNVVADPGSGGATFAADDIGGIHFPRTKITVGADGSNDGDVSSANPLPVGDAGGSLTVDGTVAVTNAGLTELAAAINASVLDVNIAAQGLAALTVASHAVTNAGTFAVQVDGAALTSLQLADDTVFVDDAAFTAAASKLNVVGGIVTADSVDSGDAGAFAMLANRQQKVTLYDSGGSELSVGGGTQYTEDAAAAANPVGNAINLIRDDARGGSLTTTDGDNVAARGTNAGELYVKHVDAIPITDNSGSLTVDGTVAVTNAGLTELAGAINGSAQMDVNIAASNATITVASHAVTNAGTFAVQVDGAALTALQVIDNPVLVDDAAFTPATSSVMMAGFEADEASTDSIDEGDAGAARMTLDRKVIVAPQPHSAGGLSIFRSIDLDEGALEVVKNSPGCVYSMWVTNTSTGTRWIKFYDATSGTIGTGTPVITWGIPGNTTDDIGAVYGGGMGIMFATGICVGASTGVADADTGAPGANDVVINVFYK